MCTDKVDGAYGSKLHSFHQAHRGKVPVWHTMLNAGEGRSCSGWAQQPIKYQIKMCFFSARAIAWGYRAGGTLPGIAALADPQMYVNGSTDGTEANTMSGNIKINCGHPKPIKIVTTSCYSWNLSIYLLKRGLRVNFSDHQTHPTVPGRKT